MHHSPSRDWLNWVLKNPNLQGVRVIALQYCLDGVAPANNSTDKMLLIVSQIVWPVYGNVFLLSGWQGRTKPEASQFMEESVNDMISLHNIVAFARAMLYGLFKPNFCNKHLNWRWTQGGRAPIRETLAT